jgi:two-component system response regulator YesN
MSFKVLIADDERVIRESLGFSVCGLASNGLEALEMAKSLMPDLILVDIRMPLLSGLQMIERTRVALPEVLFIIISGHDEFDFARKAINLGVKDYLL